MCQWSRRGQGDQGWKQSIAKKLVLNAATLRNYEDI